MKTTILFLSLVLLTNLKSFSQEDIYVEKYDVIAQYDVFVNKVPLVSKKAVILKHFGNPEKIKKVQGIEDLYWFDYYYKKSTLQIDPVGDFMGFNIIDSSFILTFKTTKVRIGDSLSILKKLFPKSFKKYTITKSEYFRVRIKDNDAYVLFTSVNGIISRIKTWEDNS